MYKLQRLGSAWILKAALKSLSVPSQREADYLGLLGPQPIAIEFQRSEMDIRKLYGDCKKHLERKQFNCPFECRTHRAAFSVHPEAGFRGFD